MTKNPVDFVKRHGVVLETAKGPVPTLAHAVTGETIRGSWWSHPQAHAIHAAKCRARHSRDVLACRIVRGKITLVHKRLWPALVRVASCLPMERLASIQEFHTAAGAHRVEETPYPEWVPNDVRKEGERLTQEQAIESLGNWIVREIRE